MSDRSEWVTAKPATRPLGLMAGGAPDLDAAHARIAELEARLRETRAERDERDEAKDGFLSERRQVIEPGADARYCETFWAQNAELESLREQLAAVTAELDALNASTSTLLRRMASLADALEQSARTTAPSRKSETERKLAKAVREVALDSIASQEPQP